MRFGINQEKFKELMLHIADKSSEDPDFGATKLNKIFFYADFLTYGMLGNPVTGAEYQKLGEGPAPRLLVPIREEMEEDGDIILQRRQRFNYTQHRVIPRRQANLDIFSAKEIALVDEVIQAMRGLGATEVSYLSHRLYGWKIAEDGETIPYESVFLSEEAISEYEILRGKELAIEHGWDIQSMGAS